jgi:Transcriptional regulators
MTRRANQPVIDSGMFVHPPHIIVVPTNYRDMSASIPKPASVAEAARPTAVEALAEKLRTRILNGDFAPGEYLRDIRMAEEYEVSRNTFRTAAQLLVGRRILRQVANRGFFVPEFSADDIVDVTRFRGVLEAEAVKMIVHTGQIPVEASTLSSGCAMPPATRRSRSWWRRIATSIVRLCRPAAASGCNAATKRSKARSNCCWYSSASISIRIRRKSCASTST